jgi:hypothetical protein
MVDRTTQTMREPQETMSRELRAVYASDERNEAIINKFVVEGNRALDQAHFSARNFISHWVKVFEHILKARQEWLTRMKHANDSSKSQARGSSEAKEE